MANADQLFVVDPDIPWILPFLKSAGASNQIEDSSIHQSEQQISEEAMQLIGKETQIPNKVCTCVDIELTYLISAHVYINQSVKSMHICNITGLIA